MQRTREQSLTWLAEQFPRMQGDPERLESAIASQEANHENQRDFKIFRLYHGLGEGPLTLKMIGARYSISAVRAKQLLDRANNKLHHPLTKFLTAAEYAEWQAVKTD